MTLENLWAGWRSDYIQEATARERSGMAGEDSAKCVFCRIAQSGAPSAENLVVWRGEWSYVVLNAYPYASGHVLVLPRRHVAALEHLTQVESAEVWSATNHALAAIARAFDPDGMNMGANFGRAGGAGIPGHVHLHALPRWSGDTNFMTSVADTRVMPESLSSVWKKLTEAW